MKRYAIMIIQYLFVLALFYPVQPSQAGTFEIEQAAASDQELARIRGGFVTNDGLLVSFGIDQAIYVNGVLNTASSLRVDQTTGGAGQPQFTASVTGMSAVKVVQIGPQGSNIFNLGKVASSLPGGFTVIQNSLNNQVISNATVINASVTNMNLFRDMNLSAALRQQLINAVR